MKNIPLGLRHSLESGDCVLFIGSGIGHNFKNSDGDLAPDGATLAKELSDEFSIKTAEYELPKISRIVELRKGRAELIAFLSKRLANLQPDENVQWLCSLKWQAIFTTNYDNGLQRAYDLTANPAQNYVTVSSTSDITPYDSRFDVPIYHLHGSLFDSESPDIIITDNDYTKFREKRRMMFELLKKHFITTNILYVGYSNRDSNWNLVLSEIEEEFYPSEMPTSYRISPSIGEIDREILEAKKIYTLEMKFDEFVALASVEIQKLEPDEEKLKKYKSIVPSDLGAAFDKNPVAVTRLISSWTYVNQAPFSEASNIELFLKGDRPNWSLIGANQYFERDIEEEVYEELLDYATSTKETTKVKLLIGPAGYGITTLLMSLAGKLVKERAGEIYMLKPARSLLEGDIEFAVDISNERCFFFIDNAADKIDSIRTVIQRLRETKKTALFMLGDRLNEWRQSANVVLGKEFQVEALSDPEINRLIDYLGSNSALNKLEPLSREMQFSAIKKNYNKELLIAMREATEDQRFDAIIESEFRGIKEEMPRSAYLITCCFYLHGAYIRDSLLADLLNINLSDLHAKIGEATEGVIIFDEIDANMGIYGARTRHRKIAEIVWERCGSASIKGKIIQDTLESLNLNHSVDARAFESFYRSDHLVDTIGSLDEKIHFFEKACKKDPESPYVRQHYSRMLYRENKTDLALAKIEKAIELDSQIKVLNHTKGLILSKMTLEIESQDIARRRLTQAENLFRKGINMARRDQYCYQSLAELYLNWARRCKDDTEITDYIERAEGVISEGLMNAMVRDSLWITSAKIQQFLGDNPNYIRNIERAVADTPGSIIARYLLGRAYRKAGEYEKAIDILEEVILNHSEEFRSYVEHALSSYCFGKSLKECIAILQQSIIYGYYDPRFIATLGGMLFMDHRFTEAEKVFEESSKRKFTASELNLIQFRPLEPANRKMHQRINGHVISVKAGYAWIESPGYPKPFLCPGSKYKGILMEKGLKLTFEPAFNAKGSIADNPALA